MEGIVDEYGRALIGIMLKNSVSGKSNQWQAWIDTAFTGQLIVPQDIVTSLALEPASSIKGELGDGTKVTFGTYFCEIDWFGSWIKVEALANQGRFPLIGVGLLENHVLKVDYLKDLVFLE